MFLSIFCANMTGYDNISLDASRNSKFQNLLKSFRSDIRQSPKIHTGTTPTDPPLRNEIIAESLSKSQNSLNKTGQFNHPNPFKSHNQQQNQTNPDQFKYQKRPEFETYQNELELKTQSLKKRISSHDSEKPLFKPEFDPYIITDAKPRQPQFEPIKNSENETHRKTTFSKLNQLQNLNLKFVKKPKPISSKLKREYSQDDMSVGNPFYQQKLENLFLNSIKQEHHEHFYGRVSK